MPELSALPQSQGSSINPQEGGGVDDVDYRKLFDSTQKELASTQEQSKKLHSELQGVRTESQETKQTIQALKKALMGDGEGAKSAIDNRLSGIDTQIDQLLETAMEFDRAGKPINVTTEIGLNALKFQKEVLPMLEQLKQQNEELKAQLKQVSNPSTHLDNVAYGNFDNQVMSAIDNLYSPDDMETREVQFDAITKRIANDVKDMQQNDPKLWDRVRRDKNAQIKLVNHHVKMTIPPKARELLENDRIQKEPMSTPELMNAWRQAKEAGEKDPEQKRIAGEIRLELLSRMAEKSIGRGSRFKNQEE